MEEAGQEPAVPGAAGSCLICLGPLQGPAAVEPCGHVFCHGCIPRRAASAAAACPRCQGPIGAIRPLQGQHPRAGGAPRPRPLHPFVVRWRRRQQQERERERQERQQEEQEEQEPGPRRGLRRRRFPDGDRAQSPPVPLRRVRRVQEQWDRDWPWQEGALWPHRVREEELAAGDFVRRIPRNQFVPEPPWAV